MPDHEHNLEGSLERYIRESSNVMSVLEAARNARLPSWRLFSGAVYQTVWNALTGRSPDFGVRDYDVAYFDPDMSEDAEAANRQRVAALVPQSLAARVDVVNQARVHLWFENEFGHPYAPLTSTDGALRRSLFTAHAVAVSLEPDDSLVCTAPYGLGDVFDMVLRPNPEVVLKYAHAQIERDALKRWPELVVA